MQHWCWQFFWSHPHPVDKINSCFFLLSQLPVAKLRIAWLEMRAATVMLPIKIPRWWSVIKHQGKPCMSWAEMSLQCGTLRIMTFPYILGHTYPSSCQIVRFHTGGSLPGDCQPAQTLFPLTILFSFALCSQDLALVCTVPLSVSWTLHNTPRMPAGSQIPLHGTNSQGKAHKATASWRTGTNWS